MAGERTLYEIAIPQLGSLILTHDRNGVVRGLKDWPKEDRPNALILFWSFRVMVGLGLWFLFVFGAAFIILARRMLARNRWIMKLALWSIPLPWIAIELGWIVAEYGRQPWTISEVLPTYLSVSSVTLGQVWFSLGGFIVFYTALLVVELYLMQKYIRIGPSSLGTGRYHDEGAKS